MSRMNDLHLVQQFGCVVVNSMSMKADGLVVNLIMSRMNDLHLVQLLDCVVLRYSQQ